MPGLEYSTESSKFTDEVSRLQADRIWLNQRKHSPTDFGQCVFGLTNRGEFSSVSLGRETFHLSKHETEFVVTVALGRTLAGICGQKQVP